MGMAVGAAFVAGARAAIADRSPYVIVTAAGGARMQEGILSLMQMPKATVAIAELKEAGLPYIVILADPTCNAIRDTPSRHVEPHRGLWVEPICGSAPIELLVAADVELQRDRAEGGHHVAAVSAFVAAGLATGTGTRGSPFFSTVANLTG